MAVWEYKVIEAHLVSKNPLGFGGSQWNPNVVKMLPQLGSEGWELVNVIPESTTRGTLSAGVDDYEMWVFKRQS